MEQDSAPPISRNRWTRAAALMGVLIPGALTSTLALAGVFFVTEAGTNLMFWSVALVVPVGPILIGLVASSGVIAGAKWFGVKMNVASLVVVGLFLVVVYFLADYVGFRVLYPNGVVDDDGVLLTFWSYFDHVTRMIHFDSHAPLGLGGYAVKAIGIVGFVAGGIFGPMTVLAGKSHCAPCQRYMKGTVVAYLPATNEEGLARINAQLHDPQQLGQQLFAAAPGETWAAAAREPERVLFRMVRCPSCGTGALVAEKLAGLPDQTEGRELSRHPLSAAAAATMMASWNRALEA